MYPQTKAAWVRRFERVMDWLYGGEYEIECRKIALVKTRYAHDCMSIYHDSRYYNTTTPREIPAGTFAIVERAKVEGKFGSCYTCFGCVKQSERDLR